MAPELMLAATTKLPANEAAAILTGDGRYWAELKLDGVRACVTINKSTVKLTNRNGVDITHRYPDVVAHLSTLGINAVVDGEIVVYDLLTGAPNFSMIHKRDAQSDPRKAVALARSMPAVFVAFDILSRDGEDTRALPYTERRGQLQGLGLKLNVVAEDGQALWDLVVAHRLEGVVLKRCDSTYRGGRASGAWIKVKRVTSLTALVNGYDKGKGSRASSFGALRLELIDEAGQRVPIGSVGTGFSNADCLQIRRQLDRGEPIIVEVEYLEVSKDGKLRHPSFKGLRLDIEPQDCTVDQLDR